MAEFRPRRLAASQALAALLVTASCVPAAWAQEDGAPQTFMARLIRDMADPLELARLPESREFTYHVASSVDPGGAPGLLSTVDHYVSLDEEGLAVLADLKGPGCVRRMYFAEIAKDCELSFYFDGEQRPRLRGKLGDLARNVVDWKRAREWPHAPASPLVGWAGGGYYCYLPLPYEKSLKITLNVGDIKGFSYQIGCHGYPARPEGMKSYDVAELSDALADPYVKLVARVSDPDVSPVTGMRLRSRELAPADVEPAQSVECLLDGPGIVRELDIQWTRADSQMQRGLVLRCYWDGAEQPSVEVPVDDLFGFDHGHKARVALYLLDRQDSAGGVHRGRLWMPMPFRKSAVIRITNEGATAAAVGLTVRHVRLRELADDFGYLHALWRRSTRQAGTTAGSASAPAAESFSVLDVADPGRLVGCLLSVNKLRSGREYLMFGETLTVDGREVRGSAMDHFFNGSDKYRGQFTAAYHAVPIQRGGNLSQFRFFIPDSVPFQKGLSLRFPNPDQEDMSGVAFWYQRRPHEAFAPMQAAAERAQFHRSFKVAGAIEAEDLQTERSTQYLGIAPLGMEDLEDYQWSNDKQLYISTGVAQAKTWAVLKIPLEKEGRYRVELHMTQGPGYTRVALYVNNARCTVTDPRGATAEFFDGNADETLPAGPVSLGVHELKKGENLLKLEHASEGRRFVVGVDCIVLAPEEARK